MSKASMQLVADFLDALNQRTARHDDASSVEQFAGAYQGLIQFARGASRADLDEMQRALLPALLQAETNWEFGCIANTCGTLVECGGDPSLAIEPILDRITRQLESVPDYIETMRVHLGIDHPHRVAEGDWHTLGREHPDHAWVIGEWYALRFTGCAAMTMLCRDPEARRHARERIDLVQRADSTRSDSPYAYYLAETLAMADDECFVVLDLTRKVGYRVRLLAVRNNFHFFTLLQDALRDSRATVEGVQAHSLAATIARGERMLSDISPAEWGLEGQNENDSAQWTYAPWTALQPDGTLTPMAWIWGEAKPSEIPTLEGEGIVLLGPLETPRSWSVGFFTPLHPALRSAVTIETTLDADEMSDWLRKIDRANRDAKRGDR